MQEVAAKELMAYWDMMRGMVQADNFITAMLLIDEVKKEYRNASGIETAADVYTTLLVVANKIGVMNPFRDKEKFFVLYQESKKLTTLDWEGALEYSMKPYRMPVIPEVLINVFMDRFEKKTETVLIAEAYKFVPNIQKIVDEHINSQFMLTSENAVYAKVLEKIFEGYDNVEILITDIYRYEFVSRRFDLILSSPIFGGRTLTDDDTFICREYDMVALENLSLHLNNGGELVIILPGRITFASGKINDLRQFIQQNYTIKELAELPEGVFECTGIKTYLLDIENTRPGDDDIVIRRYSAGARKSRKAAIKELHIKDDTFVMLDELEQQGDWSIDRIFAQQDDEWLQYQNSSIRKDMLGNVAQLFRGKAVSKKTQTGKIGVINISNIGEYEIDYGGLDHIEEEERKIANYILQEGDLLLPARGTAVRTAVFHEQSYPCIAHSNVIVIRPNARMLNSTYLKVFLDSPLGTKLISSAQQGTTVMNISYKDLNVLEVPVPLMEEQQKIANEYNEELQKYNNSIAAAEKQWKEVIDRLQSF